MFKINDYVVYRNDVCLVKNIKVNNFSGGKFYVIVPIDDISLTIDVPMESKLGLIRKIISKDEANKIINEIGDIPVLDNISCKTLEQTYKQLINSGFHSNLIRIIKTTYVRNDERLKNKKKISEKDDMYFNKAERLLYNELSIALGLTYDETKKYVEEKVSGEIK